MTDGYFENTLPDYSPEEEGEDSAVECKSPLVFDSTVGRPSRQCAISTAEFLKAALSLKDESVLEACKAFHVPKHLCMKHINIEKSRKDDFQQAAIEAAEVVWKRGLLLRVEICHGVSGNAYPFLALYRLLGAKKYLHRAREFAGFLHDNGRKHIAQGKMHGGDHPYSLFEGLAGTAHLSLDVVDPQNSRFPGFEL